MGILIRFFFLVLLLTLLFILLMPSMEGMLSYHKAINSEVLVVEGWMPAAKLDEAYEEYVKAEYEYLFVTGHQIAEDLTLYSNSFLVVYLQGIIPSDTLEKSHQITILAESTLGKNDPAHFGIFINDKPLDDFSTVEKEGIFTTKWIGGSNEADSLMIHFDSDMVYKGKDRNLVIKSIIWDTLDMLAQNPPRFIDRGRPFGLHRQNIQAGTYAQLGAEHFRQKGVADHKIIPVSNLYENKKRTYGNALALTEWFMENDFHPDAITLVSSQHHSRRTFMMYNALLNTEMEVGMVSIEDEPKTTKNHSKQGLVIRETLALWYYLIFIIPWV